MTLFEILLYFIVIVKAFFTPSNAPVRSTGPTPVPSPGATGQAGQAQITRISIINGRINKDQIAKLK